jgi:hypothetical protein
MSSAKHPTGLDAKHWVQDVGDDAGKSKSPLRGERSTSWIGVDECLTRVGPRPSIKVKQRAMLTPDLHPREWTWSGCGFDHLPGMLLFERGEAPLSSSSFPTVASASISSASPAITSCRWPCRSPPCHRQLRHRPSALPHLLPIQGYAGAISSG